MILALAFLLVAISSACGSRDEQRLERRGIRVVLITLDTLRFDSYAGDEAGPPRMPFTRAFAARAQSFERFYAASSATQPTHASLFTGLHPWEHGVPRNGTVLADRHLTVAERFRQAGFETIAVVASFPLHPRFGFAQGFDVFEHDFEHDMGLESWEGAAVEGRRFYSLAAEVTDAALGLLRKARSPRQFFWLHYFDAHEPYGDTGDASLPLRSLAKMAYGRHPDLDRRIQAARKLYDRDVAALDRSLDRVFRWLAADGERYETHVVVTADHGESFGERGALGHGSRVTQEQVHVPLVLVSPKLTPGVRRDVAGTVDLPRTLLSLAGLDDGTFRGRDLTAPGAHEADEAAFGMRALYAKPFVESRIDGIRVVVRGPRFYVARGGMLYAGDGTAISEGDDDGQPVQDAAVAGPLRQLFRGFASTLESSPVVEDLEASTRDALRALGYVH